MSHRPNAFWKFIARNAIQASTGVVAVACLIGIAGCNSIPNSTITTESTFTHYEKDAIFRTESFHFLNPSFDSTIKFSGMAACSVWVDERLDSSATDSLYGSIRCEKDTLLTKNNVIIGAPEIIADDIANWKTVRFHFANPMTSVFGRLFTSRIDSAEFAAIKMSLDTIKYSYSRPPAQYVTKILEVLNTAIKDPDFVFKGKQTLSLSVNTDIYPLQINRLISNNIWIDTSGKTRDNLTPYELNMVQWFNVEIFMSKSIDFVPFDGSTKVFPTYLVCKRIYKFLFEQGRTGAQPTEKRSARFLGFDRSGASQIDFIESYGGIAKGLGVFGDNQLITFPYITGSSWTVTPLFWYKLPLVPYEKTASMMQPGKAMAQYKKALSNALTSSFELTLFYPINGSLTINNSTDYYIGNVTVVFRYKRNFLQPFNPGIITDWNTQVVVKKIEQSGRTTLWKESNFLKGSMVPNEK